MTDHYLLYWVYDTVVDNAIDDPDPWLGHAASNQLGKIKPGEVLWIVTIPPGTGDLYVVGRMQVGWIGSQEEAAILLDTEPDWLWEADWHVIAAEGTAEPFDMINISGIAADLRFESPSGRDRLSIVDNRVSPQQLQAMRKLQPASAQLLNDVWYDGKDIPFQPETGDEGTAGLWAKPDVAYPEGGRKLRIHYHRERNSQLVQDAKRDFKQTHGRLYCEVCGTDFGIVYGEIGEDFIEAHHKQPLSELEMDQQIETKIEDLRMVCSNCHSMIHRRKPWLAVEELRAIINAQQAS